EESQVIVRGMIDGDRKAYEKFVEIYRPVILRECLHFCGDSGNAEDHLNEVLIRALISIESYDPDRACMDTWVVSITKNYLRNFIRDEQQDVELVFCDHDALDLYEAPAPEEAAAASDEAIEEEAPSIGKLRKALAFLSSRDRAILFYRAEGFSYENIAGFLKMKPGSAMAAFSRAAAKVRGMFNEMPEDAASIF
ncbi:MAG: RNA polymerase sigma factor, partial [Spirochaetes bacterium]|nr:RNA polymerase sigma factor [Spirochaetota bacterium]